MLRFEHVGVVVDDLDTALAFFADPGFENQGRGMVEGETVGTAHLSAHGQCGI